jgi:hypothetical protein
MSYMCPVCNGLQALQASCAKCGSASEDAGRLNDYLGPYAPYRPIEEVSLANGYPDLSRHVCVHVTHCPACGADEHLFVTEWSI